jgi:uncharacterized protein (DUF697 family)/predicted GTPase
MESFLDIAKVIDDALKSLGRVNIVVAGKTGVGKSTLINTVFRGEMAATGQGRPVTTQTRLITKEGIPLHLYDTRGLEVASYRDTIKGLSKLVREKRKEPDANEHIHVAWVCIVESSHRVEDAESELVHMLAGHEVPVLGVITKATSDEGFRATVLALLPEVRNVVRVRARATVFDDGHQIEAMGLDTLIEATSEVLPEGQRNAFVAVQRVSMALKVSRCRKVVFAAAATTGTVGATPIPFPDALAIVPLQVGMLARICVVWGLPVSKAFLGTLVGGAATGAAGVIAGRAVVSGLLKLIPGAGTVVGGAIGATTAAALTTAFGEAFIQTLSVVAKDPQKPPSAEELRDEFREQLRRMKLLRPTAGTSPS